MLTNENAVDFRVMEAPIEAPGEWTELIAHEPGRRITGVEPFAGFLAFHEWNDAQPGIRILTRSGERSVLDFGDEPHDIEFGQNAEWDTPTLRVSHQSLTSPLTIFDVVVATGERSVVKRTPTPNVDLTAYTSVREWATAPDGQRVPIDIVRHVDTRSTAPHACLLYGYGSYESSVPTWFSVARLSFLDRGGIWALVHPRGGGELGRQWYLDGKLLAKRNTFTDTIAAAEHLVASGFSAPDRLAIRGGSAGGLLVGACMTMRPELFAAAVAEVPFVDVVSSMSDETLPLTITEWEEWGDPREEPFASYMESYSPYDNTVATDYPALMVTAGLNDPRVSYHEPAKWVAKLRDVRTNDAPLVLRTEMGAGHAGPSGRYDAWRDEARVYAFVLSVLDDLTFDDPTSRSRVRSGRRGDDREHDEHAVAHEMARPERARRPGAEARARWMPSLAQACDQERREHEQQDESDDRAGRRTRLLIRIAPSPSSTHGSGRIDHVGAPRPAACARQSLPAANFDAPASTNAAPSRIAATTPTVSRSTCHDPRRHDPAVTHRG